LILRWLALPLLSSLDRLDQVFELNHSQAQRFGFCVPSGMTAVKLKFSFSLKVGEQL